MNNRNDISLIITGNFNFTHNTLFMKNINNYLLFFNEIIIPIWENNIIPDEVLNIKKLNSKIILLPIKYPQNDNIINKCYNHYNSLKYQIYSLIKGAEMVKTKYVMRTRMDNTFENIDKVINSFFSSPDKILFGSIYYKPERPSPNGFIHIGDQLIISRNDIFLRGLQDFFEIRNKNINYPDIKWYACEYLILYYLIKSKYYYELNNLNKDDLKNRWSIFINKDFEFLPYFTIKVDNNDFNQHIDIFDYKNFLNYEYLYEKKKKYNLIER